jgi:hypothetical protein
MVYLGRAMLRAPVSWSSFRMFATPQRGQETGRVPPAKTD